MKLNNLGARGTNAQYDGFSGGEFGTSVNLFKGEASFSYPLVTELPSKNGVGIQISASYASNTDDASRADNLHEPTGVMGLGWQFAFPTIQRADTELLLPPTRETFFMNGSGGLSRLYQTDRPWQLAELSADAKPELQKPVVSPALASAFFEQGIAITQGASLSPRDGGYIAVDAREECEWLILPQGDGFGVYSGGLLFENANYDFSRIVYFPRFEKWLIAHKDGARKVFGGSGNPGVLQWAVYHGDVSVPSARTDGQTRAVSHWNLSRELSICDDEVNYAYLQDIQAMGAGGLSFTKACYLSEVTDALGYRVQLRYGDKTYAPEAKEYVDPQFPYADRPITGSVCHQNRYETRYLSEIRVFAPGDRELEHIVLGYDLWHLGGDSAIQGATAKRLLTSLARSSSAGGATPPELFAYNTGQDANLGALRSITTSAGTKIDYAYTQKELPQGSARSVTLSKEHFSQNKVWHGGDFSAVLLYNENASCFRIYEWVGRFQAWTPPEQPFDGGCDATEAFLSDGAVVLSTPSEAHQTTKIVCYRENPDILGGWTVEVTETFPSARCTVTAGQDWFLVQERDNGRMTLYRYDLLHRKTLKTVREMDASHAYLVAPYANSYALLDYDVDGVPGEKRNELSVFALDPLGNWEKASSKKLPDLVAVFDDVTKTAAISLQFSGIFCAVAAVDRTDTHAFYYELSVWKAGDVQAEPLVRDSFAAHCGKSVWEAPPAFWQPAIAGQLIVANGTVLAFDGKEIRKNTALSLSDFDLARGSVWQAVGPHCLLQTRVVDGGHKELLAQALLYDPARAEDFPEAQPIRILYEQPGSLREGGYAPSLCGETAVVEGRVFRLSDREPFQRATLTLAGCDAASLVNGGEFIAYADSAGLSHVVRFQNGIPLPTGTVDGRLLEQPGGSALFATQTEADMRLYIHTGHSLYAPVPHYQVNSILVDDGFGKTGKVYVYDDDNAVCDSSGRFAKYYAVEVYAQAQRHSGFLRYRYRNSLSSVLASENATVPYATDGQLLDTTVFDRDRRELSRTTFAYDIARSIATSPGAERTRAIYGAVTSAVVSTSSEDGVTATVHTEYDAYSGETAAVTTTSHDVFGDAVTVTRRSQPAAAECPELARQNRIGELGRTVTEWQKNAGPVQIAEAKAVAYRHFPNAKRQILWGAATSLWNGEGNPYTSPASAWKTQSVVHSVGRTGNILLQETPPGTLQSQFYSADGSLSVGSVTNASALEGQALLCTFEPYESIFPEWKPYVVREARFAGTSSLRIPPFTTLPHLTRRMSGGDYAVAYWGTGAMDLSVEGEGIRVCGTNAIERDVGTYSLLRFVADRDADIRFTFSNASNEAALVEVFSISPFDHPPLIHLYQDELPDVSISAYGEYTRTIRDRRRHEIGTITEKSTASLTLPFYHRLSETRAGSARRNAELALRYAGGARYAPAVAPGATLAVPGFTANTELAAVYADVQGEGMASISLGGATVRFSGGMWSLTSGKASQQIPGKSADGEWLLLVGKRVRFFFNGEYLLGVEGAPPVKPPLLVPAGQVSFSKVLYGAGVSFGIRYLDTAGRVRQGQMFDGEDSTVTQNFYDEENRLIAQTKPVVLRGVPFGYLDDFASLDPATGILSGRVADAYPEDEGFPYTGQAFESTPLGRQIESGLPGKAYAIDPSVPREKRQTTRLSYDTARIPGLSLAEGRYHFMTTTSPEGNRSVSIVNAQKQQVAVASLGKDAAIISASVTAYEGVTRVVRDYLPAYFSGDSAAVRTSRYDFGGNLLLSMDPNRDGAVARLYNSFNEQRFLRTPELARAGKFAYQKYDALHRVVEEGLCSDAWDHAATQADHPDYPSGHLVLLRRYDYGDDVRDIGSLSNLTGVQTFREDGSTTECYGYDKEGRKKSKTVTTPGVNASFRSSCAYDTEGNTISTTNSAGGHSSYAYDGAGRMKDEILPSGYRSRFVYTANDLIESVEADGGKSTYGYTPAGWICRIQSPLMEENIRYRGTKISEFTVRLNVGSTAAPSAVRYVVAYDEFGRMTSALCYDQDRVLEEISVRSVTYDANGNAKAVQIGGRLRQYLYQKNSDRLLGVDQADGFSYNADGEVTSSHNAGIESIRYSQGRPVFFQTKAGNFSLTYDSAGNRLTKTREDGTQTVYLYNDQNRVTEEIRLPGGDVKQYVYGQFGLRAIAERDGVSDVYTDHLGSPRAIGRQGKAIAATHYTPFGKPCPILGDTAYGFNGYGRDRETGLYHASFRLYDPEIGRFYSIDPRPGAESPYVFCSGDPVNRFDREGDSWWGVLLGVVVGIIGIAATVATAGALLPATMASGTALVAETIVGATAGAIGSLSGALVTAACDKEPITGKMVLGAVVSGAIGGLGSLAGPLGQVTMRAMMKAGFAVGKITAAGIAIGCTVGAAAGVGGSLAYSAVSDTPISGVSIAMAGLAGAGTGLLATRATYGLMRPGGTKMLPVMIDAEETGVIRNGLLAMGRNIDNQNVATAFAQNFRNVKFFSFMDDQTFADVGQRMLNPHWRGQGFSPFKVANGAGGFLANDTNAAVVTCHGFGRHCFVISQYGDDLVWRPIKGSAFVNYFANEPTYAAARAENTSYVKLFICFSGSRPGSSSIAQQFATALGKPVYATRGIAWPEQAHQQFLRFQ